MAKLSKRVLIGTDVVSLADVLDDNSLAPKFSNLLVQNLGDDPAVVYVGTADPAATVTNADMGQIPPKQVWPVDGADATDCVFLAASAADTPVLLWFD